LPIIIIISHQSLSFVVVATEHIIHPILLLKVPYGSMTKLEKKWNMRYEQLVEFKRKKGHCMVPQKYEQDKSLLGMWVSRQRVVHKNDKMRPDRKTLLDDLGFAWKDDGALALKSDDLLWHQQFEKLVEFKRDKGHCKVPNKYEQDKSLGTWVSHQRNHHKNNKLRLDRKRRLEDLEFAWKDDGALTFKPDDKLWHQQYEKLVEFKRKTGHCKVPQTKHKDDKPLGGWVMNQRARHANNKMLPDRKELLDELDFVWRKAVTLATRSSTTDVRGLTI
jgi:hypothetical protein